MNSLFSFFFCALFLIAYLFLLMNVVGIVKNASFERP